MNKFIFVFIFIFNVFNASEQLQKDTAKSQLLTLKEKLKRAEDITIYDIDRLRGYKNFLTIDDPNDKDAKTIITLVMLPTFKDEIIKAFNEGQLTDDEVVSKVMFALIDKDNPADIAKITDRFIALYIKYYKLYGILDNFIDPFGNNDNRERFMYYLRESAKDLNRACLEQLGGQLSTNVNPFRDAVKVYSSERARNNRKALASTLAFIINNPARYRSIFPALFEVGYQLSRDPLAVSLLCGSAANFSNHTNLKTFFENQITMRGLEIWYELLFAIPQSEIASNSGTSLGYKFIDFLKGVDKNFHAIVPINTQYHYSFQTNMFSSVQYVAPHLCKVGAWTVHSGMGIILLLADERKISLRRLVVGGIATTGVTPTNIKEQIFLGLPYGGVNHTHDDIANTPYPAATTANSLSTPLDLEGAYKQAFRDPTVDNGNFGNLARTDLTNANLGTCNLFVLAFGFKPGEQYNQPIPAVVGGVAHGGVYCDAPAITDLSAGAEIINFLKRFKPVIRPNFRLAFSAGDFTAAGGRPFGGAILKRLNTIVIRARVDQLWYCINNSGGNNEDVMGRGYFYGALMPTHVGGGLNPAVAPNDAAAVALVGADRPITKSYYIEDMEANYDKELVEEFERVR